MDLNQLIKTLETGNWFFAMSLDDKPRIFRQAKQVIPQLNKPRRDLTLHEGISHSSFENITFANLLTIEEVKAGDYTIAILLKVNVEDADALAKARGVHRDHIQHIEAVFMSGDNFARSFLKTLRASA